MKLSKTKRRREENRFEGKSEIVRDKAGTKLM